MRRPTPPYELTLQDVASAPAADGAERVVLVTDRGEVECRYHDAPVGDAAVVWVFGAGGGLGGPAGGLYERIGRQLAPEGIASLEVAYRRPGDLVECVLDTLIGVTYIGMRGHGRAILVGHSFGGAVVITAGVVSEEVIGVAALSSQTVGTGTVARLSPRPLLLIHGGADEVLPAACSRDIYTRAREPKRLTVYPRCRHGLDDCREELDRELGDWLRGVAGAPRPRAL